MEIKAVKFRRDGYYTQRRKRQSAVTRIASKLSHFAEDCVGGSSALQNEPLMSSLQILPAPTNTDTCFIVV